jgi:hypothetical protein
MISIKLCENRNVVDRRSTYEWTKFILAMAELVRSESGDHAMNSAMRTFVSASLYGYMSLKILTRTRLQRTFDEADLSDNCFV